MIKRNIIRNVVQPLGEHNKPQLCVNTESTIDLIKYPFTHFNPMQSSVVDIIDEDCNVIISSPTASGKTIAMELFVSKALSMGTHAICLFPLKALTEEKLNDWKEYNHYFSNKTIMPITGDYILTPEKKEKLLYSDIIVATSEMLDSKTRNYLTNAWLSKVGLLVVDESHLIGSESRGPKLESAIMRFCRYNKNCRIVLMSATVPNKYDLVEWIKRLTNRETKLIESTYRPCVLNKTFIRFDDSMARNRGNYDQLEILRMRACLNQILRNKDDQHLIFSGHKYWGYKFKDFLKDNGVEAEFHNADLSKEKRFQIESNFKTGELKYLISTSTLSWGCHKVRSKIKMANGTEKNIEDIQVGDEVLSVKSNIDQEGTITKNKVVKKVINNFKKSLKITLTTGETCEVSEDHMFYCPETEVNFEMRSYLEYNVWKEAKDLKSRDEIFIYDEQYSGIQKAFIKRIEKRRGGKFVDIEVENDHSYICDRFVSHNCNLPARRVILAHTNYGLNPMEICDIEQSIGRSGRPKYDKEGDAYIIVPSSQFDCEKDRIEGGFSIRSNIYTIPNLAFNAVSEVLSGTIKTVEDFKNWYKNTLSYVQGHDLSEDACNNVFDLLKSTKMIEETKDSDGKIFYETTHLGKITSLMYHNPLDVYCWFRNFSNVAKINPVPNDKSFGKRKIDKEVSMALADCYEYRKNRPFISKIESNTRNVIKYMAMTGKKADGVIKIAACYYSLLSGEEIDNPLKSTAEQLKFDLKRILTTIKMIHERYGKYLSKNMDDFKGFNYNENEWNILYYRIMYGVPKELCPLVAIQGIGKEYAKKLFENGIKSKEDFIQRSFIAESIMGKNRYQKSIESLLEK